MRDVKGFPKEIISQAGRVVLIAIFMVEKLPI